MQNAGNSFGCRPLRVDAKMPYLGVFVQNPESMFDTQKRSSARPHNKKKEISWNTVLCPLHFAQVLCLLDQNEATRIHRRAGD